MNNKWKILSIREERKRAATLRKEYSQLNPLQKLWIWIKKNGKI